MVDELNTIEGILENEIDYTYLLEQILSKIGYISDILQLILTVFVVMIIIVIMIFIYKFFNMFFKY